jgi:hypothetical protein
MHYYSAMSRVLSVAYKSNLFSQFGEDGYIKEILSRISSAETLDNWCCEFGAWDGLHFSNTANLIINEKYRAVLIEASKSRYKILSTNFPEESVIKLNEFVNVSGEKSLDSLLHKTIIPKNFDLLSIDIDGCDYYVFESLSEYSPKVIVIEFNPTIPNAVFFVQENKFDIKQGASALAVIRLASSKGYSIVAITECNLIFVQTRFASLFTDGRELLLEDLRNDIEKINYVFSGYDGSLIFSQKNYVYLPWHDIRFHASNLQILPRYLRKFSSDYGRLQVRIYRLFRFFFSTRLEDRFK